jgi:hypothetical protein
MLSIGFAEKFSMVLKQLRSFRDVMIILRFLMISGLMALFFQPEAQNISPIDSQASVSTMLSNTSQPYFSHILIRSLPKQQTQLIYLAGIPRSVLGEILPIIINYRQALLRTRQLGNR